jgi:hypothetical protein
LVATVSPVPNGGIPHTAELKLTFKDGGAFEFYNTYTALLDRLHVQGEAETDHLEDLPVYSNEGGNVVVPVGEELPAAGPVGEEHPEELPPTYDDVAAEDGPRGRARMRRQ